MNEIATLIEEDTGRKYLFISPEGLDVFIEVKEIPGWDGWEEARAWLKEGVIRDGMLTFPISCNRVYLEKVAGHVTFEEWQPPTQGLRSLLP